MPVLAGALVALVTLSSATTAQAVTGRENLARGAQVTASSTHPWNGGALAASNLVDGSVQTRWAAADDAAFPITIDLALTKESSFDEVYLDEYTDSGTDPRVNNFSIQEWDADTNAWNTVGSYSGGIGRNKTITLDEHVTTERVRLSITDMLPGEIYTPTLTEIQLYSSDDEGSTEVGEPANDPFYAAFDSTPTAQPSTVGDNASVLLIPGFSENGNNTLRTVSSDAGISLQQVTEETGLVSQALDLSDHIDTVTAASAAVNWDVAAPRPLNVYLLGEKDGKRVLLTVTTPGAGTLGTASTSTFTITDSAAFKAASGIALEDLALLNPFSTGMLAIYSDGDGYTGKRLTYALAPQAGREPFALPFDGDKRTFASDSYGNVFSSKPGQIDSVSLYSLNAPASVEVEGLGTVTQWMLSANEFLAVADDANHLALVNSNSSSGVQSTRRVLDLGDTVTSIAYVDYLKELQITTTGEQILRYAASNGAARTPLDVTGTVVAGSLRSYIGWRPATTSLIQLEAGAYSYRTEYITSPKPYSTLSLNASTRGAGMDFAFGAAGTDVSLNQVWYEYSLDDGKTWAKRGESWNSATGDIGSVVNRPAAQPSPLNDEAPYLRQETGEDVWATSSMSRFESNISVSTEQQDALWRYRVESPYGSAASASTRIVFEDEKEVDTTLRVTAQPESARVSVGETTKLSAEGTAAETPSVQWQRSSDGSDWSDIADATSPSYSFTAAAEDAGAQFRAVFSSGDSEVVSDAATVNVMVPAGIALGAAPAGSVTATDAAFTLDLSEYAHDWVRDTASPNVALDSTGFDYSN
ncbi:MAG: discoidin domain-containing protein, partial [Mycetocola sp.]